MLRYKSLCYSNQLEAIFIILLFFIFPLLSLPLILNKIYLGKRYAFTLLALYIGCFGLLYPPAGDLYRYRNDYFLYENLDFSTFISFASLRMDYFLSLLLYTLSNFNIENDISRFIYAWIGSELIFSIFYNQTKGHRFDKSQRIKIFILFVIVLLYVSQINLVYRHGLSSAIFAYGSYNLIFKRNKFTGIFCLIFAIFNHFSYIVFAITIFFVLKFNFKGNRNLSIFLIIFYFFISADYLTYIVSIVPMPDEIKIYLLAYTNGYWAQEFLADQSFKNKILLLLNEFRIVSLFIFYILFFKRNIMSGMLSSLIFLLALVSVSKTISVRFENASMLFFLIYFIDLVLKNEVKIIQLKKILYVFVSIGLLYTATSFYSRRREYSISMENKLLQPNFFDILSSNYSEKWVNTYIDERGEPIGLYK